MKNIYTGETVSTFYEALGYKCFTDNSKKILIEININHFSRKYIFDYKTNTEFSADVIPECKFIILSKEKNHEHIILTNHSMANNHGQQLRQSFGENWTYFKSGYMFKSEEKLYLEYTDKNKNKTMLIISVTETI
ncbi:MAG: hypothetical protein K2K14_07390 [Ruminococcus sp.]|nr:hypothetical protein [Ruminococcus sp.]